MSIRIRTVGGVRVALCAARTAPKPGDLYLNDGDHEALSCKFARDYNGNGLGQNLPVENRRAAIMELEEVEVRDLGIF